MPAQLIPLNDGPSILVDKPILLLGRHPECDIQIDSRKISRRHCCIAQVNDYLVVRDLDSTNGIRINGVRVVEGTLRPGDELTIGSHRYQVTWDDASARPGPTPGAAPVRVARAPAALPIMPMPNNDDDDLLEACDEPIPLPDPRTGGRPMARPGIPGTLPNPRPPTQLDNDPIVLPDNLELLPNSGSFPGAPGAK